MIERLWRTDEIYLEKPAVADKRRNVMHYVANVFPDVLPWVDQRLTAAWDRAGFDPALLAEPVRDHGWPLVAGSVVTAADTHWWPPRSRERCSSRFAVLRSHF